MHPKSDRVGMFRANTSPEHSREARTVVTFTGTLAVSELRVGF